ncbi:MAG: hypothetical protein NTY11_00205 [Candidatus Parcubacteria bacterium]|nr:hypothetical protein [Candidatus Parcubacteria bacterium]
MQVNYVVNLRGEREFFSLAKVLRSALRAGAPKELAQRVALQIEKSIYPGIKTSEIFDKVNKLLKKEDKKSGLRFSLREVMRRLGPSGFPFENYIGDVFSAHRYEVFLNRKIKGKFAIHEIDFLARRDQIFYIGECKYRIFPGERIDLPIMLAFYAKFLDLKDGSYFNLPKNIELKPIMVTNAKFSSQAVRYANGMGIELLGWRYPLSGGLESMIEAEQLYPITILPSFKGYLIESCSKAKLMLAKDVLEDSPDKTAKIINIEKDKILPLISEAKTLLND